MQQAAKRKDTRQMKNELDFPYSEFFLMMLKLLADKNCHHCHARGYVGIQSNTGFVAYCKCLGKRIGLYQSLSRNIKYKKNVVDASVSKIRHMQEAK